VNDCAQPWLRESRLQSDDLIVVDSARPSTIKTRIIAHSQLVVRADRELANPVNGETEQKIISKLREKLSQADALVVSDYDKGVVTSSILAQFCRSLTNGYPS